MSYRKFIGSATAEGRMWVGGVEWKYEVDFNADESDLNIESVHFTGWYNGDLCTDIDPIPVDYNDWTQTQYDDLEGCIYLWMSEYGYD